MNLKKAAAGALVISAAAAFFFLSRSPSRDSVPEISSAPNSPEIQIAENVMPAVSPSTAPPLNGDAKSKAALLDQILASRNDNDPRLDRELKILDDATKDLFREKYNSLAPEKRNERGTIVFLIGRNLTGERDFSFFCDVLREAPCFSLSDCRGNSGSVTKEDYHHESGEDVTLAYPQYVALSMLGKFLQSSASGGRSGLSETAVKTLRCGQDSRVEAVLEKTNALLKGISR